MARIVRQVDPVVTEGLTTLHNVHQKEKSEFLRSTDPLFRPVDMATAPDGTLYVVDMYHGIIQEGQWAQKGTYLRAKIEQYQLDKVIRLGRIWRITHRSKERDKTRPRMFEETPAQLLRHLEHPNGWWRDKAQQLIVLSRDKSIVPQLEAMAREHQDRLARFHAIWSLEGLGALRPELTMELFKDPDPRVRIQALRASETLYKVGNKTFGDAYVDLLHDSETEVVIQAMLTADFLDIPDKETHLKAAMKGHTAMGVQVIGEQLLNPVVEKNWWNKFDAELTGPQKKIMEKGAVVFNELCVQCHGNDGTGTPLGNGEVMAPPLSGSVRVQMHPEYVIKTVMHGMEGPLDGKTYPGGIMVGMKEQSDEWIAAITSYIRQNLSNTASMVTEQDVAKVRAQTADRDGPYQFTELWNSVPQIVVPTDDWKVTASHTVPTRIGGTAAPSGAFNYEGWSSGGNQKKGMWFQIELPEATSISELHFNAPPKWRGWGPDAPPPLQTYPRAYELKTSVDGKQWHTVAEGQCDRADVTISFEPVLAKFVRMVQTAAVQEDGEIPWSMRQMKLFGLKDNAKNVN